MTGENSSHQFTSRPLIHLRYTKAGLSLGNEVRVLLPSFSSADACVISRDIEEHDRLAAEDKKRKQKVETSL